MPLLQSVSKPNLYRVKACSNCGLEDGGDVLFCAGCGTELSGAGLAKADAVPSVPSAEGFRSTGMSPPLKQKSLQSHILEWFLVLFALHESGIFYLGYYLHRNGLLSLAYSSGDSAWICYLIRNGSALGILGYVLFRNSNWCLAQAASSTGSEDAMSKSEGLQTSERGSGRVRIFELFLVLFVAFAHFIFLSLEILLGHATLPDEPITSSLGRVVYEVLSYAGGLGLLSYVLSRSSRGFQNLGLRWTSRDVAVALPLALGSGLAYWLLLPITLGGAEMLSGHQPHGPNLGNIIFGTSISMATVLLQILIGFFEELIVRGYLMTEVKRFTGSILFAILCSVAVQTSYHFYQGGPLALAHIGGFMVFAMFYAKTNRILPVVLAHIALDLNALVMHALWLP